MDWSATILKIAGATPAPNRPLDGIDLLPILRGERPDEPRILFWRRVDPRGIKTHRAIRDGDWKYIEEINGRRFLYDLADDVAESRNHAALRPELVATLRHKLDRWESDVDPPLYPQSAKQID